MRSWNASSAVSVVEQWMPASTGRLESIRRPGRLPRGAGSPVALRTGLAAGPSMFVVDGVDYGREIVPPLVTVRTEVSWQLEGMSR